MAKRLNPLSPQRAKFVAEYLKSSNATEAATSAGYGPAGAAVRGHMLLKLPEIAELIESARKELIAVTHYDLQASVVEIDRRLKLVEGWKQGSAIAKLQELKLKVHGLLVERHEVTEKGFQLVLGRFGESGYCTNCPLKNGPKDIPAESRPGPETTFDRELSEGKNSLQAFEAAATEDPESILD